MFNVVDVHVQYKRWHFWARRWWKGDLVLAIIGLGFGLRWFRAFVAFSRRRILSCSHYGV